MSKKNGMSTMLNTKTIATIQSNLGPNGVIVVANLDSDRAERNIGIFVCGGNSSNGLTEFYRWLAAHTIEAYMASYDFQCDDTFSLISSDGYAARIISPTDSMVSISEEDYAVFDAATLERIKLNMSDFDDATRDIYEYFEAFADEQGFGYDTPICQAIGFDPMVNVHRTELPETEMKKFEAEHLPNRYFVEGPYYQTAPIRVVKGQWHRGLNVIGDNQKHPETVKHAGYDTLSEAVNALGNLPAETLRFGLMYDFGEGWPTVSNEEKVLFDAKACEVLGRVYAGYTEQTK